jgi:membrane protein YdbS with pleckstrin-like domain
MHDHDGKDDSWMMWVMMIRCAVLLVLVALFALGGKASGAPAWVVIGGVAIMVIAHFFIMGRSQKHFDKNKSTADGEGENKDNKDHSNHSCCH